MMKRRVAQFLVKLRLPGRATASGSSREALSVTFAGMDIAEISRLPLKRLRERAQAAPQWPKRDFRRPSREGPGRAADHGRYVGTSRGTARSRSRLSDARAQHADVVAGRASAASIGDASAIESVRGRVRPGRAFGRTTSGGHRGAAARPGTPEGVRKSLFVVEHELDVVRHADWIVDVGPDAGEQGGQIIYSGPLAGLGRRAELPDTALPLRPGRQIAKTPRDPRGWLKLRGVTRNNLDGLDADIPLGVFTSVTGIRGRASRA